MPPDVLSLDFGDHRVQVVFGEPRLAPGVGVLDLVFDTVVTAGWLDAADTRAVASEPLHLAGALWSTNGGGFAKVGDLAPRMIGLRGFPVSEAITVQLTTDQLLALEGRRDGDALALTLRVAATLPAAGPDRYAHRDSDVSLRVEAATWVRMLDGAGTETSVVLRVPAPVVDPGASGLPLTGTEAPAEASRSQALARLRQARAEVRDGRCEAAVATCRLVMDSLDLLDPTPSARATFAKDPEQRDQRERWAVVRIGLRNLASAAHHDGPVTAGFAWRRQDAEAILAATAGLLARPTA